MGLRRQMEKRRSPLEIVFYLLAGLAGVYVFLLVWGEVFGARWLILVLVVAALMVLQAKGWRESRQSRTERRKAATMNTLLGRLQRVVEHKQRLHPSARVRYDIAVPLSLKLVPTEYRIDAL